MACCDGAGADHGLGFVLEVIGFFLLGTHGRVGEDVVEDCCLSGGFFAAGDLVFHFEDLLEETLLVGLV